MTNSITERFKAKLQAEEGREVEYNGFPLKLRFAPLEAWIHAGRVPQYFASQFLHAQVALDAETPDVPKADLEDAKAFLQFKRSVIEHCAIEPRITYGEDSDAIRAEEIDSNAPGLLHFIFMYGIGQTSHATVKTVNGEVSAQALATFRDDGTGPDGTNSPSSHGADVQLQAVGAVGA
jgi:hypothetical protein